MKAVKGMKSVKGCREYVLGVKDHGYAGYVLGAKDHAEYALGAKWMKAVKGVKGVKGYREYVLGVKGHGNDEYVLKAKDHAVTCKKMLTPLVGEARSIVVCS
ncbi:hypothetical protein ACFX13_028603 [Malus domestica]